MSPEPKPQHIRKACLILGVPPDELSKELVVETWKQQIIKVHPAQGGDIEAAIFLNTAKDTLISWLDQQGDGWEAGAGVPRRPFPAPGGAASTITISEPEEFSDSRDQ